MAFLSYQYHNVSMSKCYVNASLPTNSDASSPPLPPNSANTKPSKSKIRSTDKRQKSKLQQQLTLIQIERAVGAGSYRDSEPDGSQQRVSIFKDLFPSSGGDLEGPLEKKLRETGEWMADRTEGEFRSSGKKILMFFLKWVLPIYILMFLVTTGIMKLPFSTPFVEDLLM